MTFLDQAPTQKDMWWFGVRWPDGLVREFYGRHRVVRPGETLTYDGIPVVYNLGMHASPDAMMALTCAPPGATVVHRVRLGGLVVEDTGAHAGLYAGQSRSVLWAADCERELYLSACDFAERALLLERACGREPHPASWAAVEEARAWVRGEIEDEALRAAARAAARATWEAGGAAWAAARAAALAAQGKAARAGADALLALWAEAARAEVETRVVAAEAEVEEERRWQSQHLHDALMALAPGGGTLD